MSIVRQTVDCLLSGQAVAAHTLGTDAVQHLKFAASLIERLAQTSSGWREQLMVNRLTVQ